MAPAYSAIRLAGALFIRFRTLGGRCFKNFQNPRNKTQRVCHARVPWSRASHLRRVIWHDHAAKSVSTQDGQNSSHVHVALVDEGLSIMRHFSHYVPKMDVCNFPLLTVLVHSFVDIALSHLRKCTDTKFQGITIARHYIDQSLIHVG